MENESSAEYSTTCRPERAEEIGMGGPVMDELEDLEEYEDEQRRLGLSTERRRRTEMTKGALSSTILISRLDIY